VDILVNNAGAAWGAATEDHSIEAWDKLMNLNVRSLFLLSQRIGKQSMIPNKYGRIINIASIAGVRGGGGDMQMIAYHASKGAGSEFHSCVSRRLGPPRHYRQRARTGILPVEHDEGHTRGGRRRQTGGWCTIAFVSATRTI
jgi:NAD(P)-dependent dehydrogenase (short-subunit alcohol dehydrogenase family)